MIDFDGTRKNLEIREIVDLAVTRGREIQEYIEHIIELENLVVAHADEVRELTEELNKKREE